MESATQPASGLRKNYLCVQALRAVAATLVVFVHSVIMWFDRIAKDDIHPRWMNGAAGVDIFFVISGFVMAISLPGLANKSNKAGVFLWRRFTRIVPLYWGATAVKVATLKLWPSVGWIPLGTPWHIVASFLFIPTRNSHGLLYPVLPVGWTLDYEMFFYLLFAAALAMELSPVVFLTPCLTALALCGAFIPATWPDFTVLASPLVMEFLFGIILAHLTMRGKLPGNRVAIFLVATGFLILMLISKESSPWRFLAWGVPALAMVTGAVALEDKYGARLPKWLLNLGDASYALYLSHTFVMPFNGKLIQLMHLTGRPALVAAIVLGLGISLPFALLIHRYVERPLMDLFKKRRVEARPAPVSLADSAIPAVETL